MDHSLSPTDPRSGDVLGYIEQRRRSLSSEKSTTSKRDKRLDPRRQTQPVQFVRQEIPEEAYRFMMSLPKISPIERDEPKKPKGKSPEKSKEAEKSKVEESEKKTSDEEPSEELPAPPPPLDLAQLVVSENIKAIDESSPETVEKSTPEDTDIDTPSDQVLKPSTSRTERGVLETDF